MKSTLLLHRAKVEPENKLGPLLENYRHYLLVLAQANLHTCLKKRVDASDVVQETLCEAYQDFADFQGESVAAFRKWLRTILCRNLLGVVERHLQTQKRDIRRECSLRRIANGVERSSMALEAVAADRGPSPVAQALQKENAAVIAEEIARLAPDHQQVVLLRSVQELKFSEVATAMERSEKAVTMLWLRALESLGKRLSSRGF